MAGIWGNLAFHPIQKVTITMPSLADIQKTHPGSSDAQAVGHEKVDVRGAFYRAGAEFCLVVLLRDSPAAGVTAAGWHPPAGTAAPSPISTEGELKATVFAFRDGNLVAQYKYYWWHNGCYLSYAPANFVPAPPAACA
jgi:hypothetical protein